MKKLSILIIITVVSLNLFAQNQFNISQSMLHQPFINPAAQASYTSFNAALFYKNQWTGFEGAPRIGGLNINTPIGSKKNNSLGLTFINDRIGVNNNNDISLTYAYRIKTGKKSYLSFGLSASMILMQSNLLDVRTINATDAVFTGNTETFMMPNFKFGTYFFMDKFYFGLSSPNLLKNRITYSNKYKGTTEFDFENMHFYLHSGYKFELKERTDLMTSVLIKHVSGAPLQIELNAQLTFMDEKFGIGAAYRTSKELTIMANYQIIPELKLGYAYDYNIGQIGNYSSGTHEVILIYKLVSDKKIPIIEVPRF